MDEETKERAPDPVAEVAVMGKLAEALKGLDTEAIGRVLRWAFESFGVAGSTPGKGASRDAGKRDTKAEAEVENGANGQQRRFDDLADLYAVTMPEQDTDKALVAGYFLQFCQERTEFNAQEVNTALKNLGHPIKNITSAFDNLKARKPVAVMQLKKSGSSKQARKTFKLTVAGKQAVELMMSH